MKSEYENFILEWFDLFSKLKNNEDATQKYAELSDKKNLAFFRISNALNLSEFEKFALMMSATSQIIGENIKLSEAIGAFKSFGFCDFLDVILAGRLNPVLTENITSTESILHIRMDVLTLICGIVPENTNFTFEEINSVETLPVNLEICTEMDFAVKSTLKNNPVFIMIFGEKQSGKHHCVRKISAQNCLPLITIDCKKIPGDESDFHSFIRSAILTCIAFPSIICLKNYSRCNQNERTINAFLKHPIPVFVLTCTEDSLPNFDLDILALSYETEKLSKKKLRGIAQNLLTDLDIPFDIRKIYNRYNSLTIGKIIRSTQLLRHHINAGLPCSESDFDRIIKSTFSQNFNKYGSKLNPKIAPDKLVLSQKLQARIDGICDWFENSDTVFDDWNFAENYHYGRGLCALFYGASGTGKTMAAHVIAYRLKLPLLKIDLSKIIDKYIGETEKHITEIFAQAKNTNALLFFDEADALFSKRSEVADSHDKYANSQTACLLQEIENYDGIVILATNLLQNFDEAFMRRIHHTIHFFHPGKEEREKIWSNLLDGIMPVEKDISAKKLSSHSLTAGEIKNVFLNAAHFAASSGGVLRQSHIDRALTQEFEKKGHLIDETDIW